MFQDETCHTADSDIKKVDTGELVSKDRKCSGFVLSFCFIGLGGRGEALFFFGILGFVSILIPESQHFEDINLL